MRWPSWLITAGVLGLAAGLSFAILRRPPVPIPVNAPSSLALSVTAAGNGLRLSWDHQTSHPAGHGVLWIKDGQDEQRFELDSKQLSEGSVAYWPKNSDVTFRLVLLPLPAPASPNPYAPSEDRPNRCPDPLAPPPVAVAASHAPAAKASRRAVVRAPKPPAW